MATAPAAVSANKAELLAIADAVSEGTPSITPNTVEVYVSRLRAKLEPAGIVIRTVRGFGYLWEQPDHAQRH